MTCPIERMSTGHAQQLTDRPARFRLPASALRHRTAVAVTTDQISDGSGVAERLQQPLGRAKVPRQLPGLWGWRAVRQLGSAIFLVGTGAKRCEARAPSIWGVGCSRKIVWWHRPLTRTARCPDYLHFIAGVALISAAINPCDRGDRGLIHSAVGAAGCCRLSLYVVKSNAKCGNLRFRVLKLRVSFDSPLILDIL